MKIHFRFLLSLLAAALVCGLTQTADASHFRFSNLSWRRAPGANPLAVEITVTEAWQQFSKGTIPYDFGDGSGSFNTATATRIATLTDQVGEGYEVWRYTTTHIYPSNGVFTVFGTSCCRISSLVNAGDDSESLTMLVDLRNPANTGSPVTTAPVILQMQAGTNNSIALPIVDPDGDAFTVRLATGVESDILTLPTVGGNAISVTAGGVLNWNTVGGTSGQKFALQVVIEENRAGNTTGTNGRVPLDFIIELAGSLTNLTPTVTGASGSITLAANQPFTTTFVGTDPEGGPLRVNHQGLPPGATITPADGTTNSSPTSVTFSWTPAPSDVGSSYAVLIFFTDQGGLQRAASFALTVSASTVRDFELLSINAADTASGNGASLNPVVSSNGQFVAFVSDATNLVANDSNRARDVFWRDRTAGTTRLVSRTPAGASGNADSDAPVISPDGRYVAFHSRASNLVPTDSNTNYDVFVWDAHDNSVTLVSRTAAGGAGAGDSFSPQLSANGRVVSFASTAADLVNNDTNGTSDAFARDLDLGVTYLASLNTNGFSGNGSAGVPVLSANGRFVAFLSRANDLVTNDFNLLNDVFVHDLQTRATLLVSVNVAGTGAGNRLSFDPVISADGRYIAFASQATNLVTLPDTNDFPDVFVRDMQALSGLGQTKLVSVNGSGTAAGGNAGVPSILPASFTPFLSADGTKVLFVSLAQDLVANDSNGKQDVFLRDHVNNTTTLISTNRFGTGSGNAASGLGAYSMSADLRYVAFFSEASDLGTADTNGRTDVFLRDLATNSTKIISRVNLGGFAANGHSFQPVLSADGSTVLFTSEADNLDTRDANAQSDVFAAATTLGPPNFGVVDVGLSISSVSARTVGSPFTLTVTVTNHSANLATGLVMGNSRPDFLQSVSGTVSQGTLTPNLWVVGDLAGHSSATATVTLVATNLGEGDVIVSMTRRDQLDSNLNNNSALSTVTVNQTAAGALFYLPGNTAYLSRTNSPFFAGILAGAFTLEDFESGAFNLAGVTASAGSALAPSGLTDSVDADDGVLDGFGTAGHSFFAGTNAVTFFFNPAVLGRLPTKVGIVLTDGDHTGAGIEAFDTNGVSLGVLGPFEIGDHSFLGETAEDRFLGVEFAGGISALRVFYLQPGFELDHLQFDVPTTDLQLTGTAPGSALVGGNFIVTLSVTNLGPAAVTSAVVTNAEPGPISLVSAVPSQGTFSGANGQWAVGSLAVGAGATLTLTVTPTNVGQIQFYSRVLSEVPERNTANDLVTQTVLVPNQPPVLTFLTSPVVVLEDAGPLTAAGFASFSGPEPGQSPLGVSVTNDNPALFAAQPALAMNGTLTFRSAADTNGTATITVIAQDNGGTANGGADLTTNTFIITVTPVNDAPGLAFATNNFVVLEDAAAQTVPGFVTATTGPADEAGQSITNYTVTSSVPGMFAVAPAVALNGTLTFTLAANSNGTATITVIAQDNGGTADGGVNQTTSSFTITVTPVNDAPSFTFASNTIVVLEDAGAVTLPNQVTSTATGPVPEPPQAITNYVVTTTNTAFFTVQPALDVAGTLTFTLAPDVNGTAFLQVQAQDDGDTANGGTNGSATVLLTLAVTPVNDGPTLAFTTNNLVVLEDAAAQTFAAFAALGPVEAGQAVTNVFATNSSPAMFAVQPYFTVDGTLRFTPATNANGAATVTVIAQDNGGTDFGGVNRATNTFTLTITPVNDAPDFTLAIVSLGVAEDIGLTTYSNLVSSFSPGPADEAGQTLVGYVLTFNNAELFAVPPAVDVNGTLTYQGATNATGTITVSIRAQDSGDNAHGGTNLSVARTLTLFLQERNDPPEFTFATNNVVVLEDAGAVTVAGFITSSSAGPVAFESAQAITNYSLTTTATNLFAVQPALGLNGVLTFTPAPDANGAATVIVSARDNGGTSNSGQDTSFRLLTITVTPVNDAPSFTFTNFPATEGVQDWVRDATANSSSGVKIITDDSGNVIVAGDEANGASEVTTYLVHVVKYSNAGVAQWTNIINGEGINGSVRTRGLAVDSTGAVILTGFHSGAGADFLTMKFAADGSLVWSNRFDSLAHDEPFAVVVDGNNKVIVTGKSVDGFYSDYLTIKYLADGTPFWTNRSSYSSVGNDAPRSVAVDAAGDVYVTGDGSNTDYTYAYTLKLAAATGVPVWTNQFDIGGESSTAEAVRVDNAGNVIVAGTLNDNLVNQSYFGVVKYSSAGAVVWTNLYARNTEFLHVHGLAVDASGNVLITGNTEVAGNMDFTTIKYLADGTPAWTNHYDGAAIGRDHPNAIAVNAAGEVMVTGDSAGTLSDDFVTVKYTAAGVGVWTNRYDGSSGGNDKPNAVAVDSGTNVFVTGAADGVMRTIKYAFVPSPGANQTMTNTVGAVTVSGFVVSSSVGPTNESAQTLGFVVANDNLALFTAQPAISAAGVLTYTVDPAASGVAVVTVRAQDSGGTANGGVDTSVPQTFNLTVLTGSGGASYAWLGGTGDWNNPANWTPRGVPGVADTATLSSGTAQLTNSVTVANLTLAGGTLEGLGSVTVRSAMNWTGGVLSGSGTTTIIFGGTLTISGVAEKNLNRRLDNYGTVTWTGARITGDNGPVLNNYAGALFDIQTDATLFDSFSGGARTFNNSGTLRKSVATGTSTLAGTFNNSGAINVQTGTLQPTDTINLNASSYSGAGTFLVNGGVLTLNGTLTIGAGANVEFAGGTLTGTGTLVGTLNWTGGIMAAPGTTTVATNGTLNISGAAEKNLNRQLDNYGTVTWTGARITGDNAPVINNFVGALFDLRTDTTLFDSFSGGARTFNNSGTLRKSAGVATTLILGAVNNASLVSVETGTVGLGGGGSSTGGFTNATGAVLEFTGGTHDLSAGARFTGAGLSRVNGGVVNVATNITATVDGTFEVASGTLGGDGELRVLATRELRWTGGIMSGSGRTVIATNGTLTISGAAEKNLNRRLDNYGTATWTGARITGDNGPVLNNFAGALFDVQTDATLFDSFSGGARTFNNSGTLRKSVATGTSTLAGTFNNSGAINVQTGTLQPTDTINLNASSYSGAGTFLVNGAVLTLNGTLTIGAGANVEFAGGTLTGTGTLVGTLNWTGGVMAGPGTTTVAANGTLNISGAAEKNLNRQLDNLGTVTWSGARITGDNAPVINNQAGALFDVQTDATLFDSFSGGTRTLNNSGTVRKSVATGISSWQGVFNNTGVLELQSGILFLADDYAPGAGSSLKVFLGGLTAGTQFGQLQVGGTATLNGALNIVLTNSFAPIAANSFLVVSSSTRVGTFASVTGDDLGGGLSLVSTYVGNNLTLVTTDNSASVPLAPRVEGIRRTIRWPAEVGGGYELQTAAVITGPWTPVLAPVALENGVNVVQLPDTSGTRFYRLVRPTPRPGDNPTQ